MCYYLKAKSYGCLIFHKYCRATCGLCHGCYLPPTKIPCTDGNLKLFFDIGAGAYFDNAAF